MVTNKLGEWAKARLMELAKEMDLRLNKYWDEEIEKNFGKTANDVFSFEEVFRLF